MLISQFMKNFNFYIDVFSLRVYLKMFVSVVIHFDNVYTKKLALKKFQIHSQTHIQGGSNKFLCTN